MKRISFLLLAATCFAVPACSNDPAQGDDVQGDDDPTPQGDEWDKELAKREYDYPAALRIAALRLTGDLPTVTETNTVATGSDNEAKRAAYETLIQDYMNRPSFARQMMYFWRDTFKMGETAELDTAPAFAAMLSVNNGNYMDLFRATTGACPTFDEGAGTFTAADCGGNNPKVGVLGNQGVMKHWFGNFAFRRVKWVQETFDCLKFPVEINVNAPQEIGGPTQYTGAWPYLSISGTQNGGRVNFLDVSSVLCVNCHQTLNHSAPLFAYFDENGAYQNSISVPTPLDGAPLAKMSDYLPDGESTAWRYGVPAATLADFGNAMASDPSVAECGVARMWNWAMGKSDIVDTLQEVPVETIRAQLDAFTSSGYKLKDLIYSVYTADAFVKF
ncbi:MAG: hypothetical protein ACTHU0_33475 [Kofleriaceae bacterium]